MAAVNLLPCRNHSDGCPHTAVGRDRRCSACHAWYYRHAKTERPQEVIIRANIEAREKAEQTKWLAVLVRRAG